MDQVETSPVPEHKRPWIGRVVVIARKKARARIHHMFTSRGPGFRRLAEAHAGAVAGDTLVAMALAGTLYFDVPSTEARDNVTLYLLITEPCTSGSPVPIAAEWCSARASGRWRRS
jgi:hypothetical protein